MDTNIPTHKKGLLLLYGESFREGGQGSRQRDTKTSLQTQREASASHVELCNHIKNTYNIDMDILINTYDTKYENELKSWYQGYPLEYISNKELIGFQLVQDALNSIDKEKYDFVLFTRTDVFIKPRFLEIFNPEWNKIYFLSQSWTNDPGCGFIHNENILTPRVNPIIKMIPKSYFKVLHNINIDHDAWKHYKIHHGLNDNEMGFMCDDYHDADSYKDFNPYYKMIGRPENSTWHDQGKKINKSLFGTNTKIDCIV
jgi:hypothetical protein